MRILLLGGTGAIGEPLCHELAQLGHEVFVTSRRPRISTESNVLYIQGNAKKEEFLKKILLEGWDSIIDFMVWTTSEFKLRSQLFLESTSQYVFLSSYRVYADTPIIREDSPRLLDVIQDEKYLASDEYALRKARCENILFESGLTNWTIVRPSITYDGAVGRLQLGVYESAQWMWRVKQHLPVPFPKQLLDKFTTMTSGRDAAKMIGALIGKQDALGEAFTVSTKEHHTWNDVVDIYAHAIPLKIFPCELDVFEKAFGSVYQLRYDRMYNRVIDNSKILQCTELSQRDMTPMATLSDEAKIHMSRLSNRVDNLGLHARLDQIIGNPISAKELKKTDGLLNWIKYFMKWYV